MDREISRFLDFSRVFCTLLVVLGHVELNWVPGMSWFLIPLGNECLAVLFLVSGFVIGFVSDQREKTLKDYLIHRCARAYSLALPCIVFCLLVDFIGKHFMLDYYQYHSFPPLMSDFWEFMVGIWSLTFTTEVWGADMYPGSMAPFWTLPLEFSYYLIFGAAFYLRGRWRWIAPLALIAVFGPTRMSFLPLWLLGAATYWLMPRLALGRVGGRMLLLTAAALLIALQVHFYRIDFRFGFGYQEAPELWPYYVVGLLFALMAIGFHAGDFSITAYTGWVQWVAGACGTIYLLHFPLCRFLNGLIPFHWTREIRLPLILLPTLGIALLFAQFTERRRHIWRRGIEALWNWTEAYLAARKKNRLPPIAATK